jgi:SAM-dependent methyltransferase
MVTSRDPTNNDRRARERGEVARSAIEARLTPDERLRTDETNTARYLDPPRTTAYPLEYAYALLGDVSGKRVLDFGCGSGENSLLLARRGAHVVGIDISTSLLAIAARRLAVNGLQGAGRFVAGSAHELPVRSGSVDAVFGIAVLHHLDLDAAAAEIDRVLAPGGRAIFQEPIRDSPLIRALRRCVPYRAPDVSPFERPLTSAELERFSGRFQRYAMRAFWLPFVNVIHALPPLYGLIHRAHRLDAALLRRIPALERYAGLRVFEIRKQPSP